MPDINLQDEGSMDYLDSSEEPGEGAVASRRKTPKKGRGTSIFFILLAVVILGGGGAFLLDKLGVVQIFGKKKAAPAVAQLQDQTAPTEVAAASGGDESSQMIETPPVDEKGKAPAAAKKPDDKAVKKSDAASKPMPAPTSGGNLQEMTGEYTVQVSSWRDKEIADQIVKRLADAGYPAFVQALEFKGGTWYTVRVGRYASRKDAEQAVQNFAEELKSNYWIGKAKAK